MPSIANSLELMSWIESPGPDAGACSVSTLCFLISLWTLLLAPAYYSSQDLSVPDMAQSLPSFLVI